jgi:hypothetical protein
MAYTITPLSGVALNTTTTTNPNSAGTNIPTFGPLGAEVFGSDGKRYVFVKTSGNVTASSSVTVNTSTFVATYNATGDYTSPGTSAGTVVSDGSYVWVSKASV